MTNYKTPSRITHAIGRHCGSSAIRDLLEFNGLNISEAMCFGLGSGLGVTYLEMADAPVPFLVHVRSLGFEARVFESIGIPFEWQTFESPESAATALEKCLDAGHPTLLLTDIFYLPYFNSSTHFPGHAIAAWSRNPETGAVFVTDTERPSVLSVTREALTRARFSTQPPFIHYGNMFTPTAFQGEITPEMITGVIHDNAKSLAVQCQSPVAPQRLSSASHVSSADMPTKLLKSVAQVAAASAKCTLNSLMKRFTMTQVYSNIDCPC